MNTHADKTQEDKSQSVANAVIQKQGGGESTFQFVDNRPEAMAQRKLQEMAKNSSRGIKVAQLQVMLYNHSLEQQPIQKKENVIQLLSEEDEENKRRFWQIYKYRSGLKEAIEFLFETYNIGSLDAFDLVIDDGGERFHGMTEFGFNHLGQYRKPRMTISSAYIWRMYEDNFERILRTLKHEMKHVTDRNDRDFMANRPTGHEMEFRAYYDEIFDNSGSMPEHSLANKKIRAERALDHLDQSGDRQSIYGLDERQDLRAVLQD